MRVLLLRTWLTNIGNGFIDKGAKALLKAVLDEDDEIIEASGYPNYFFDHKRSGPIRGMDEFMEDADEIIGNIQALRDMQTAGNVVNVGELVDVDAAVMPGCVLYEFVLGKFERVFEALRSENIPLVLIGAGGADYSDQTHDYVKEFIQENNVAGLITRDKEAFQLYGDYISPSYRGIDCAFFINDWYTPPEASDPFVTATFDKKDEPTIETSSKIIRPTHTPFNDLSNVIAVLKQLHPNLSHRGQKKAVNTENLFVSDSIEDYLFVYANAVETHSDRIHACVPALAYGNPAKFYHSTPRAGLFSEILEDDISDSLTTIDREQLDQKKQEQISMMKSIVDGLGE